MVIIIVDDAAVVRHSPRVSETDPVLPDAVTHMTEPGQRTVSSSGRLPLSDADFFFPSGYPPGRVNTNRPAAYWRRGERIPQGADRPGLIITHYHFAGCVDPRRRDAVCWKFRHVRRPVIGRPCRQSPGQGRYHPRGILNYKP